MTEMNIATILTLAVLLTAGGCIREKGAASEKVIRFEPTRESLSQWEMLIGNYWVFKIQVHK